MSPRPPFHYRLVTGPEDDRLSGPGKVASKSQNQTMARYQIKESESAVLIEIADVAGKQEQLLGAFAACQAGQCSCPTDEYEKLATMNIERSEDEVRLHLEPKAGQKFNLSEIAFCLDYTTEKGEEAES